MTQEQPMDRQEDEDGASVPQTDYFGKATELIASYDRLLVGLYSSLIAGVVVLLLYKDLSAWAGAFFLLALVMFIFGIGHALLEQWDRIASLGLFEFVVAAVLHAEHLHAVVVVVAVGLGLDE